MIPQLQQIFRSITKSLEVLYVIEGIKPCARILIFEDELSKVIDFLNKNKIETKISDFKVIKQSIQSEFYSDKSVKIDKNSAEKDREVKTAGVKSTTVRVDTEKLEDRKSVV